MEGIFQVYLGNLPAGKVQVIRQGLYYKITCRCQINGDMIYRLYAVTGDKRENLGVVVPDGDGFVLEKKIPIKQIGEKEPQYILSMGAGFDRGTFVPICPEEPFAYIDRLKTAFLETENGKIGIHLQQNPGAG